MSHFPCTRCGTAIDEPAPDRSAVCPNCGQVFEPAAPRTAHAPRRPPGYGRDDRRLDEGYGARAPSLVRPPHSALGVVSTVIGTIVIVLDLLIVLLVVVLAS